MDLATIIGLILGFGSVTLALFIEGGSLGSLMRVGPFILVIGGTFGCTIASFPFSKTTGLLKVMKQAFFAKPLDHAYFIRTLVKFAEKARREGLLVLEEDAHKVDDEFLQKGLRLAIDGTDHELVRDILRTDLEFLEERHKQGAQFFQTLGGFAPTLGIIGTVMGLIQMLENLSDPGSMGPAIAMAFTATLYGVSSANLLFLPLGNKLKIRSAEEQFLREIMIEGILSIQAGDNPRIVEEKLKAFLPPKVREQVSPGEEKQKEAA